MVLRLCHVADRSVGSENAYMYHFEVHGSPAYFVVYFGGCV